MEKSNAILDGIFQRIEHHKEIEISGLSSSSAALILYSLYIRTKKKVLFLTTSIKRAEEIFNDVVFFQKSDSGTNRNSAEFRIDILTPWDTLPYEEISPYREVSSRRIEFLYEMMNNEGIFIIPLQSLIQKVIPRNSLTGKKLVFDVGSNIHRENLVNYLLASGFKRKDFVEEKGDFSIRGGIADIYSGLHDYPIRIELMGDEVVSIREFDPHTQRSIKRNLSASLFPVREVAYPEDHTELLDIFELYFEGTPDNAKKKRLRTYFETCEYFQGVEYYLPLFYDSLESVFDYFPAGSMVFIEEREKLLSEIDSSHSEILKRYSNALENGIPAVPPQYMYLNADEIKKNLLSFKQINFASIPSGSDSVKFSVKKTNHLHVQEELKTDRFLSIAAEIKKIRDKGYRVYITAKSDNNAERMITIFLDYHLSLGLVKNEMIILSYTEDKKPTPPIVIIGNLTEGFFIEEFGVAFITEEDIFGKRHIPYRRRVVSPFKYSTTFQSLKQGDYIVHVNYGIGRFLGTAQLNTSGRVRDFLMIEYQDDEKLYVPAENLNLVQKYIGVKGSKPVIEKLGSQNWLRVKQKAQKAIETMAKELLELYAERQVAEGISYSSDDNWMREFENRFEYDETPHQLRTIKEVKKDMEMQKPMDRLVCGDVGYGKTEVAMRAAFKAVLEGKQVAVLVPTTILAHQHYQTFSERFSHFPVRVEMLSRFCKHKKQKEVIEGLMDKKIDIVIGTHKLILSDIDFNDLGLLIIDEEHRFGVKHKEKIKNATRNIDVLTLTATPIPRTLQFSLTGIRDISIIETPPEERHPIKTYVAKFSKEIIIRAVRNELGRGGQIYFVHNHVKSLSSMEMFLRNNIPEAKIGVAHGQMKSVELEKIMVDFVDRQFDILLCTTIIESGLDIPAVNTIVINRADRLGLAQLYQLRGRVGRSNIEAFAYLLVPSDKVITDEARKRLMVIEELTEFGAGFKIAAHDLEIRGAGNILGEAQSGNIAAIGYDLYCKLIEEAITKLKGEEAKKGECVVDLKVNAYIPEAFISDSMERVSIYKKVSEISEIEEIEDFRKDIIDQYGKIPLSFENIFLVSKIKLFGSENYLEKISECKEGLVMNFSKTFNPSPEMIGRIASSKLYPIRFIDDRSMLVKYSITNQNRIELAIDVLGFLKDITWC